MYEKKTAKNGRDMYFKDGRLVARKNIPEDELERLDVTVDPEPVSSPNLETSEGCVFCGQTATTSKYINGETALLCESDYLSNTTGEVAAQMRLTNDERRYIP